MFGVSGNYVHANPHTRRDKEPLNNCQTVKPQSLQNKNPSMRIKNFENNFN